MKTPCFFLCVTVLSATVLHAGPVESAIVAAMKLPDAPNYRWHTDVTDDARTYEIAGETDRATDFSLVTLPMTASPSGPPGRPRGGRPAGGASNTVSAIYKGAEKFVVQDGDNWKRSDEMTAGSDRGRGSRGGFGGPGGGFGGPGGPRGRGPRGGREGGAETPPARSNLQNTLSRPHEEIAIIVAGAEDMKADGEVISGRLSDTAAKLLLVHDGQKQLTPMSAGGSFRLWIRDGQLVKYETRLEGVVRAETPAGRVEYPVHQTATTTVSNLGTTKVDVPDAARRKLGA